MGSGKSTVGRLLAEATGWPRYDNDQILMELYGKTARDIVAEHGDEAKREAEDAALAQGLKNEPPFILDAAGGTIDSESSRQDLGTPIVIWLRASPATLYERSVGAAHRPFLDNGEAWFEETTARRNPLYESVADITLNTDDVTPTEVVEAALKQLARHCPDLASPE